MGGAGKAWWGRRVNRRFGSEEGWGMTGGNWEREAVGRKLFRLDQRDLSRL